jgi:NTE family protein
MASMSKLAVAETAPTHRPNQPASGPGQIVLVLQGGGALGAYQAGVCQALHETGIEPDWIIGTSIGAINASLIAGNDPRTVHAAGWGSAALTKPGYQHPERPAIWNNLANFRSWSRK